MKRVIAFVACGFTLAGCTSWSGGDFFAKPAPTPVTVQIESQPPGAEAKTTLGQTCRTPCALSVVPDKEFSVSYTLTGFQPQTVAVQLARPEGDPDGELKLAPNPVYAELVSAKPAPKRAPARKPATASAKPAAKPPAGAPAGSPWPPVR